jgi:hypothetical protein
VVCNFVNKPSIMAAEFVNTVNGGEFLIVDQFLYRIDRNILPIRIWKFKTHGWRATAKTDGVSSYAPIATMLTDM